MQLVKRKIFYSSNDLISHTFDGKLEKIEMNRC